MTETKRKLTTILATDCVGFSRSMEKDEDLTLQNLKECRSLIDPMIKKLNGRIFYTAGDSVIAEFESPVECVSVAIDFQKAISERNKSIEKDSILEWRIGIHLDDVIIEGDNVYGNGVNIAARLESVCAPKQILISPSVYDKVKGKIDITLEDAGTKALKNISEAYQVYAISPTGSQIIKTDAIKDKNILESNKNYKPKLAVLPFDNMNNNEEGGYLVDGIVEDLISEFSRIHELEVLSRQTSFAFRETNKDISEFCKKFGVDFIVSGSIRCSGKRVRISIELSDAFEGNAVWNEKYDRILDDIFDVQDEIVRKISIALLGKIELSSLDRANRKPTQNLTSYELLLKGKDLHHKFNKEACMEAIETFNSAINSDKNNAQAYAWKACAIGQGLARNFFDSERDDWWNKAVDSVEKAKQLNKNDFEVHRMLAEVALSSHNFKAAERRAKTCYELVPSDPRASSVYGEVLIRTGSIEKGIDLLETALDLDPVPMGQTNSDKRTSAVLFGYYMDRNRIKCLELISKLNTIDLRSWIVLAKISNDEEIDYTDDDWYKDNKNRFKKINWAMEVDRFHLNNDSAKEKLIEFATEIFK